MFFLEGGLLRILEHHIKASLCQNKLLFVHIHRKYAFKCEKSSISSTELRKMRKLKYFVQLIVANLGIKPNSDVPTFPTTQP